MGDGHTPITKNKLMLSAWQFDSIISPRGSSYKVFILLAVDQETQCIPKPLNCLVAIHNIAIIALNVDNVLLVLHFIS